MSKRKTKVMSVNISAGTFATYEEAVKEANAIRIWLQRLCTKKGYSCKAVIGISKNNPATGSITTTKKGGRGRPSTTFERRTGVMRPTEVEAHIHIVILANPADWIVSQLTKHLNKKYGKKVVWSKDCSSYAENAVKYAIKQSLKIRTLEYDHNDILSADEWGFEQALEEAMDEYRNIAAFTKAKAIQERESVENNGVSGDEQTFEKLQYNKLLNTITDIVHLLLQSIHSLYNLYSYQKEQIIENIANIYIVSLSSTSLENAVPP